MRRDKKRGRVEDEGRFDGWLRIIFKGKKNLGKLKKSSLHNFLKDYIVEYITHGGILIGN